MRAAKKVTINGREIQIHELNVSDVRDWLRDEESDEKLNAEIDLIGHILFADITLDALCRMTDINLQDIDELYPSDIHKLIEACREVNPDFFSVRGKLVELSQALQGQVSKH